MCVGNNRWYDAHKYCARKKLSQVKWFDLNSLTRYLSIGS